MGDIAEIHHEILLKEIKLVFWKKYIMHSTCCICCTYCKMFFILFNALKNKMNFAVYLLIYFC